MGDWNILPSMLSGYLGRVDRATVKRLQDSFHSLPLHIPFHGRSPEITGKGCPESIRQVYQFATRAKYIELCFEHNAEKWYAKYKSRGGGMGWRSFLYSHSELHRDHLTPASGGTQRSEA